MENGLDLVSTDELVDQLMERHDCGVIMLGKNRNIVGPSDIEMLRRYKGDIMVTVGLLEHLKMSLLLQVETDDDDDDYDSERVEL